MEAANGKIDGSLVADQNVEKAPVKTNNKRGERPANKPHFVLSFFIHFYPPALELG